MAEGGTCEHAPQFEGSRPGRAHLLEDGAVLVWRARNRYEGMILGWAADERRAGDIDLVDRLGDCHSLARDRLCERIQVHHHQLEWHDTLLGDGGHIPLAVA